MIEVKTKPWGNSIGIVIPKEEADKLNIGLNEGILIDIKKISNPLKELFGALKFKKPTEELLKESRRSLESKYI